MVVEDGGALDLVSGDFEDDDPDYEGLREEVPCQERFQKSHLIYCGKLDFHKFPEDFFK